MPEPLLDHLPDLNRGKRPTHPPLWWWATGLGMAILLLAHNLSGYYIEWPLTVFDNGKVRLSTEGLIRWLIFTAGTAMLVRGTLRYNPAVPPERLMVSALGSGVLAQTVFQVSKFFSILQDPSFQVFLEILTLTVVMGLYCAALAYGLAAYRKNRGILPLILALATWLIIAAILLSLTGQSGTWF